MLYGEYKETALTKELFKNPPAEFRGAPFWAWNSTLEPRSLEDEIDMFNDMGFGGFNMHVRQGLETEYLGREFFGAVRACVERGKKHGMLSWLYDEDRWPSGCAGGKVTKTVKHRIKALVMTPDKREGAVADYRDAIESGAPVFVAAFSLNVNSDGVLVSYRRVEENEDCPNKRYFYCITAKGGEPRYNFQSYVDTLSKDAIDSFKEITYDAFYNEVGDEFGKAIPAIFTDEPQSIDPKILKSGHYKGRIEAPWTWDFPESFKASYGIDITERLPEIFYKCQDESDLTPRYYYYRHLSERFCDAFFKNLGDWCEEHNIMFTGHLMCEDNLIDITRRCFDPMLLYSHMQLPGIDVLFDRRLFATAKQCESVVRQMGKIGMLSELYGVTGWDYDFRGHKSQGDWQACLGVTVRVPHLCWQTMKGEGKRDYPASIFYQSPWYKEYRLIEDHYARVNTALTRGRAVCNIAVLHPIESFWTRYASEAECGAEFTELNSQFLELCNWLLTGSVSFDYVSESLLPELCKNPACPLEVGAMKYDTIILDNCENLRPYTIEALEKFAKSGGKILFSGKTPRMSNARTSKRAEALVTLGDTIKRTKTDILGALSPLRDVTIKNNGGGLANGLLYTRRTEDECDWIFICHANKPELAHLPRLQKLDVTVSGLYRPTLYDTLTGETSALEFSASGSSTHIYAELYDFDSLLINLVPIESEEKLSFEKSNETLMPVKLKSVNNYRLSEPNSLLLDMAEWSIDNGKLHEREELMRIDEAVRRTLGLPLKRTKAVQPYAVADEPEGNELYLRFTFDSMIEYEGSELALENLSKSSVRLNGTVADTTPVGYFVDKEIRTCRLPKIVKGANVLEITMPFGVRTDAENCFILGSFGTAYRGSEAYITELPDKIAFGDSVHQGLAFYGANITYDSDFELDEAAEVMIEVSYYRGALISVDIDGKHTGYIWKSPFRLLTGLLSSGCHRISLTLFGNRYNSHSALHALTADKKDVYMGPDFWRTQGFEWSYEYNTRPFGILKTPVIYKIKRG